MPTVTNKLLLQALIGMGVLNVLLCTIIVFRENTNGDSIAKLTADHQADSRKANDDLLATRHNLEQTNTKLTEEARKLSEMEQRYRQTSDVLASVEKDLSKVKETVTQLESKPPWTAQFEQLNKSLESLVKTLQHFLPKEKLPEKTAPKIP